MKRRNLIKTALASAATLALPPQVFGNQQVTPDAAAGVIGGFNPLLGIPSRFAFGGQFNFGEVTLYQHLPKSGMTEFFQSMWNGSLCHLQNSLDCKMNGHLMKFSNIIEAVADKPDTYRTLLFYDGATANEIMELKEITLKYPNISVICSQRLNRQKNPTDLNGAWFADNVISFNRLEEPLLYHPWAKGEEVTHETKMIKNRNFNRKDWKQSVAIESKGRFKVVCEFFSGNL